MQKYDFGGYQVEIAKTATLGWYEKAENLAANVDVVVTSLRWQK